MKVFDIFSKRQKRERGEIPDVYQYEIIPRQLRVQVVHILQELLGEGEFCYVHDVLCREYGIFTLDESYDVDDISSMAGFNLGEIYDVDDTYFTKVVFNFFFHTTEIEKAIDVIEVSLGHHLEIRPSNIQSAIAELNHRFQEHGVGYQYESGKIIRVDSQLIHSEVVRPAMSMLSDPMYQGANAEFLSAHEHYRNGRYKECLNDCLKAFESCLKAICEKRGWNYKSTDNAKRLIDIVFAHELIPNFMQSHFSALRNTLESGVPTVRNRLSGHGQGKTEVPVPESIAGYALHLTASNILLLARADDELNF